MKKKIIGLAVAASLMLTGVVSAASVWGSYKGNDIIRITSNGVALKTTDVPAISYNGRTMIPISMLGQLGIGYVWDQKNKTVDVKSNEVTSQSLTNSNQKINLVKVADYYIALDRLGTSIKNTVNSYEVIYNHYTIGTDPGKTIEDAHSSLTYTVNLYNSYLSKANDMINFAVNNGYAYPNISEIFNDYSDAIDHLNAGYPYLEKLSVSYNQQNYNLYFNNSSAALDLAYNGGNKATNSYNNLISLITR
ncbi:hypothetical protein D3C81_174140 [compost metagenome]